MVRAFEPGGQQIRGMAHAVRVRFANGESVNLNSNRMPRPRVVTNQSSSACLFGRPIPFGLLFARFYDQKQGLYDLLIDAIVVPKEES